MYTQNANDDGRIATGDLREAGARRNQEVGFAPGDYPADRELVINPTVRMWWHVRARDGAGKPRCVLGLAALRDHGARTEGCVSCYDRFVLQYIARPPTPALANIVEYVWASQGAPAHARERVVPTGTLELFVSLVDGDGRIYDADGRGRWSSGGGVAGAYRRPFMFDTRENASVVGVHFKPGQAGVVLGVPPGELMDRHVDLEDIWGGRARALRERLCAATTTSERFAMLEAELLSRLDARRVHPAVSYALDVLARPQTRVGDIAKAASLTQRRLIELFTAAVGITPKRFGRVLRFHRATALARSAALDWTRIAHLCGYYDQAHLIRDFHELADMTPSDLMRASVHVKEHHQLAVPGR